ncbi:MAG: hypothetical protein AB8G22_14975 [Saprospiraceae bacterium]
MNNRKNVENNTLLVTSYCFKILLEMILKQFKEQHKGNSAVVGRVTQLYGFGNYNASLPNLRQALEKLTGGFINGKYLYDKQRELQMGKPLLKLNGYYKTVLFQYIGYEGVVDFTKKVIKEEKEKERQLALIKNDILEQNYFYVCYYYGEYKEIVKCQVVVLNNWKNLQYTYLYPLKDGTFRKFLAYGTAKRRGDILHVRTKTLMDGRMIDGGEDILYVGHTEPGTNAFMLGVFSAFDINNRVVAGKIIFEKCDSKAEMIAKSTTLKIPAYIAQELRNVRIENDGNIPNNVFDISSKSPYNITYDKIPGNYTFTLFQQEEILGDFQFSINSDNFKLSSLTEGLLIVKDNFELIQNGSVLHFSFQITGIAFFTQLEVFIKTYYLNKGVTDIRGVYSGLDIENRLISGELKILFEKV